MMINLQQILTIERKIKKIPNTIGTLPLALLENKYPRIHKWNVSFNKLL